MSWDDYDANFCDSLWRQNLEVDEPNELLGYEIFDFQEVLQGFQKQDQIFVRKIIDKLASGIFVILRKSFSINEIELLKHEFTIYIS